MPGNLDTGVSTPEPDERWKKKPKLFPHSPGHTAGDGEFDIGGQRRKHGLPKTATSCLERHCDGFLRRTSRGKGRPQGLYEIPKQASI